MTVVFQSCHEKIANPNHSLTLADYESLDSSAYALNSHRIREGIDSLSRNDRDSMFADFATRGHYAREKSFVWINRKGIDARADSLVSALQAVDSMGFNPRKFRIPQIAEDIKRMRMLDFDEQRNRINIVAARLEYNLTKAYLRYAVGQRFGFMNPTAVLNHLDVLDSDSNRTNYRTLFDIKIPHANKKFVELALHKVQVDSLSSFLHALEPRGVFYNRLQSGLHGAEADSFGRMRMLVNMERCRWRVPDYPGAHEKYILVNIPSYHLRAVDGDSVFIMRTAFGSVETKTPILISKVKRMDINPQWIMPKSIIKTSILPRLGNSYYFMQRQYFIRDRKTGKNVSPRQVSRDMLLSGQYLVAQRGGEGNALGRIIFRFDNNLSIYLHDTSSRDVFNTSERDVSHGCVRVEKPFDLAVFMLQDKDESLISKIHYSMQADVSPVGIAKEEFSPQMQAVNDTLQRKLLIGKVEVNPQVPIFILYFTLYPDESGKIEIFEDVYGYDGVIYRQLQNYI